MERRQELLKFMSSYESGDPLQGDKPYTLHMYISSWHRYTVKHNNTVGKHPLISFSLSLSSSFLHFSSSLCTCFSLIVWLAFCWYTSCVENKVHVYIHICVALWHHVVCLYTATKSTECKRIFTAYIQKWLLKLFRIHRWAASGKAYTELSWG